MSEPSAGAAGPAKAVIGDAETLAVAAHLAVEFREGAPARDAEYHALGIDEFVLSGYPHPEEAYWFGEGVLPRLAARGLWRHPGGRQAAPAAAQVPFAS